MINQKQKMRKSALVGTLLSSFLLFGMTACESQEEKVENAYNVLKNIANYEYKRIKKIDDDADYIKGINSASFMFSGTKPVHLYWVMYTETDAISIKLQMTKDTRDNDDGSVKNEELFYKYVRKLDYDFSNEHRGITSYVGSLYNDDAFKQYAIDEYTTTQEELNKEQNKENYKFGLSEKYGIDSGKPFSYLAFKTQYGAVSLSMTGTNLNGDYISNQDSMHWINQTNLGAQFEKMEEGNGDYVVAKDKLPITHDLIEKYIEV